MKTKILTALMAIMAFVACDNNANNNGGNEVPPPCEELVYVDNLIEQGKDFDAETLVQGLPGIWEIDSEYMYDESWQIVRDVIRFKGEHYWDGGYTNIIYTFNVGGEGECSLKGEGQEPTELTYQFDWSYDANSCKLIMVDDEYNSQPIVSAFGNGYLVLDRVSNTNQNIREIYKRVTEN